MYSITLMAHLVTYKSGAHDSYSLQTTETTHITRTDSKGQMKYRLKEMTSLILTNFCLHGR